MTRRDSLCAVGGGVLVGLGLMGLAWEYIWHNVPSAKDLQRVIKEVR